MSYWPEGISVRPIVTWPGALTPGWKRERGNFSASWSATLQLLARELREVGATAKVLQVAIPENQFRIDGYPRATARQEHPGVILSFTSRTAGPLSFPCDRFEHWQTNVRAIALAMEALRKVDRYGITRNAEQYQGWKAIGTGRALGAGMSEAEALDVLGAAAEIVRGTQDITTADLVRRARGKAHPDRNGGSREAWDRVEAAALVLGVTS